MTFTMDTSAVTHFFPGLALPIDRLAGGISCTWNYSAIANLPVLDDPNWPFTSNFTALTAVFSVVGEGKTVDFACFSTISQQRLYVLGHPEEVQTGFDFVASSSVAAALAPTDPAFVPAVSTLTHTLRAGVTYYLAVSGIYIDADGHFLPTDFTLNVSYSAVQIRNPQHYWPGAAIPMPLPWSASFSNEFVLSLPTGVFTDPFDPKNRPGYDANRPTVAAWNFLDVLWSMVGEGKWVDFWLQGQSFVNSLVLYEAPPDLSSWSQAAMPNDGSYYGASQNGLATSGGENAGLRVFLKAGYHYVLDVSSAQVGPNPLPDPTVPFYNLGPWINQFYIEVSYTPLVLPDLKSNAWDVIIPHDGATYTSPNVLNTGFTTSAEDPEGTGSIWATAWWTYVPTADCVLSVSMAIVPQAATSFACTVYAKQSDGSLVTLASGVAGTLTVPAVHAGDVLFIQIGGQNYYNQWNGVNQPLAQKYQLQVTGAKSAVQAQGPPGPPNDLRAHATLVSVSSDDNVYLSDDTTLTYATPGAVGTEGPYITDPEAPPLYQTAWWVYRPVAAGSATFRAHSSPADDTSARIEILDGGLTVLGVTGMSQTLVFDVGADHTYYIVLGTSDPGASLSSSFVLTGPPTGGAPPINDLRPHAIAVGITNDGDSYLSTNTQLDYATPQAVGATAGPYIPDLEAGPLYQTAWWIYLPTVSGTVAIRAHSDPVDDASVKLMVLHGLVQLTSLATLNMSTDYSHAVVAGQTYYYALGTTGQEFASASFVMTGPSTVPAVDPNDPNPVDPNNPNPTVPPYVPPVPGTTFTPTVTAPAKNTTGATTETGTSTLLDLVRAFSTAVHRAVRITGPTTIEMVDPDEPVPAGWSDADAAGVYVSAARSADAAATALSTSGGDAVVTATAQLVTDDVRILYSGWRIPGPLPMYELPPGSVQRVTYTFSPQGFQASVDLHYAVVPIATKEH